MRMRACSTLADAVPLHAGRGLFLKPAAEIDVRLRLPAGAAAAGVSGFEACEAVRRAVEPLRFAALKLSSSDARELALDAEFDERRDVAPAIAALRRATVRLAGVDRPLEVEAREPPDEFPTRHDWDSFFRDAADADEMKPGERPDTLHVRDLPVEWFAEERDADAPSEALFKRAFERFGRVRRVDVPACDPHRKRMKEQLAGVSKFSFDSRLYFEGYVQYVEYSAFVRAMDALRGMKLAKKGDDGIARVVRIRVDFDKKKHLSDASVKRRAIVRERLVARERNRERKEKEELAEKKKREEADRLEKEKNEKENFKRMQEREQRRKEKQLKKLKEKEADEINSKIAREKRKLVKAHRKLQTIRLLEELFKRLQVKYGNSDVLKEENTSNRTCKMDSSKKMLKKIEKDLLYNETSPYKREKLFNTYKNVQEQELEEQRLKLQKAIDGKIILRSALDTGKNKPRTLSISSLSSDSDNPEWRQNNMKRGKGIPNKQILIKKEPLDILTPSFQTSYEINSFDSYGNQGYNYHPIANNYCVRPGYYPSQEMPFSTRGRNMNKRRGRGSNYGNRNFRNMSKISYYDAIEANKVYYRYFKNLTEGTSSSYRERKRSYTRSRSKSYRRSYSKSRSYSRSRTRSSRTSRSRSRSKYRHRSSSRYTRSYSHSRSRSKSRAKRSFSRSDRSRKNHHSRSKSYNRSHRSRSHSNNKSRNKTRSKSKTKLKSKSRSRSLEKKKHKLKSKSRSPSKSRCESTNEIVNPNNSHIAKNSTDFIPRSVIKTLDQTSNEKSLNQEK